MIKVITREQIYMHKISSKYTFKNITNATKYAFKIYRYVKNMQKCNKS